ncbi:myomesin-3 isoform X1 [Salvelinus fontinalis]|uniref:myomesin-3 isoform X1 n=1 Tax=Salvelinus fontinalis TaxID=8038 RepID=UPI0024856D89|nr:myomesin-3 isoform X1 [Salvelinus fontinalis]
MATKTLMTRVQEEQSHQMSHSMALASQIKKKTFTSSDEEASYSEFYPIIPGDVMSVKEILNIGKFPRHRTWDVLKETMAADEQGLRTGEKWTLFGNEAEKVEVEVLREQRFVRQRCDRMALRRQAEQKASIHLKYLEDLSQKAPDFPIPLRAHMVWEGMGVKLSCTIQGCPPPRATWYKDGVPLSAYGQAWNYSLKQKFGLNTLEIRRCSVEDAGEYKVVAKSSLGEATTIATLVVNSYQGAEAAIKQSLTPIAMLEREALFEFSFPPTWAKEGENLTLQCAFSSALLPFQQDVAWFRDGVQLRQSSRVELQTALRSASLTLKGVHKEQEGMYMVRLRTWEGVKEHKAYIFVKDASAVVSGGPGSPLDLKVSDVQKDYVFLTWEPPSADGAYQVEGYFVERCDIGSGQWVRCNDTIQKACHYPVRGLSDSTIYQFRVCAVNQAGVGRPSKATEPVITTDPLEHTRTMVIKVDRGREITITKDQLESQMKVPFPPTGVHACEVSDNYAVLSWTEPEPRGKEQLTFYVERSIAGKNSWQLASMDITVGSPRFPMFNLQKGKSYCFRVRSVNKFGVSEPSEPSPPISLVQPQAAPAPATSVLAIRDTDSAVLLQWQEPKEKEGILGYYLYYSEAGKQEWRTVNNKPTTNTKFTVNGLKSKKEYVFRVKSVGRAGNSIYSNESPPILVKAALIAPSPSSAIALLLCTGSEMILTWRAPANNGGDPVRGYYLDQKDKELDAWRKVNTKPAKERQHKVCNLDWGHYYQFRVFAANVVGVGKPSEPSEAFLCEEWTMPEPGCPYDLECREVRHNSLVLLWALPLYEGQQGPITGYLVELSEGDQSQSWTAVNEEPIADTFLKVSGLQAGRTYRFRVCAFNKAGMGIPSLPSELIRAQTQPGTRDIEIGVDNDGFIFLAFEATEITEKSTFVWSKNYKEAIEAGRARVLWENNRSILTFTNATKEDLGLYTAEMSDNPDISSSFTFTAEDLDRLTELGWHICHPLIALRSKWQVEVSEKGNVRLWMQTESLSNAAELRLILNDREISSTAAHKINFDKASGLIEILFDQLSKEDEGSYTAQLCDDRAKNQFTLVLVDEKFRQTLAQSMANRMDYKRKSGPHFLEFLSWTVTEDCEFIIKCKVTNVSKDTTLKWFKDGVETPAVYDQQTGVSTMTVQQVTKKEAGHYKAVVSDGRGQDATTLELLHEEYDKLLQLLSKQCALSAGPVRIQCTAMGFKLYCSLKYYISYMKTSWHFKESRIDQLERCKPGSSMQKLWVEVFAPTENDKGKYTLEMFDGQEKHTRSLDLSGQAFADALLEHQRLKQVAVAEKNRARVTKGLPDVVAIMENKSLCLTCFTDGDPAPEMFWLRNDKGIVSGGQFNIANENKCSTLTVNNVTSEDTGNYSIFVRNQYGSQTVNVTVSVYKHGEKPPPDAVEM